MPLATSPLPPPRVLLTDLRASIVVFLVALPLCLGVAVASGAPPAAGLITGIVGGLVVGLLPGSKLQVSGPAAGLVVLVYGAIETHGIAVLGPIVLLAGVIQLGLAALRLGTWFRAIALPVVKGMLAGIGLLIIVQQLLVVLGSESTGSGPGDLGALPGAASAAVSGVVEPALIAGAVGLAVLLGWRWAPKAIAWIPGSLVAVITATLVVAGFGLDAARIELPGSLAGAITLPSGESLGLLAEPAVLGLAVALALVASAESLLSAVAVDRMHDGEPTRFNAELGAQGVGNTVAGALGALPMTAVIVRSTANVEAGAQTKVSRVLHGAWLLLFFALLPGVLAQIPIAALGAVLIMAGVALVKPADVRRLHAEGRGELVIYAVTIAGVFVLGLLEGVGLGLALAAILLLAKLGRVEVRREADEVIVEGPATFLAVPKIARELEAVPPGADAKVRLDDAPVVDPAAADLVEGWRDRQTASGGKVTVEGDPRFDRSA